LRLAILEWMSDQPARAEPHSSPALGVAQFERKRRGQLSKLHTLAGDHSTVAP
jgi:hypothetical protein